MDQASVTKRLEDRIPDPSVVLVLYNRSLPPAHYHTQPLASCVLATLGHVLSMRTMWQKTRSLCT